MCKVKQNNFNNPITWNKSQYQSLKATLWAYEWIVGNWKDKIKTTETIGGDKKKMYG